jgi:hypothetical protein
MARTLKHCQPEGGGYARHVGETDLNGLSRTFYQTPFPCDPEVPSRLTGVRCRHIEIKGLSCWKRFIPIRARISIRAKMQGTADNEVMRGKPGRRRAQKVASLPAGLDFPVHLPDRRHYLVELSPYPSDRPAQHLRCPEGLPHVVEGAAHSLLTTHPLPCVSLCDLIPACFPIPCLLREPLLSPVD